MRRLTLALLLVGTGEIDWTRIRTNADALASDDPRDRASARHELSIIRPTLLPEILAGLENAETRFAAACAAAAMGERVAGPALVEVAATGPPALRIAAFEALRGLDPDAEPCLKAIMEGEPRVALAAGRALTSRKDAALRLVDLDAKINEMVRSDEYNTLKSRRRRVVIAGVIAEARPAKGARLLSALEEQEPVIVETALLALFQCGEVPMGLLAASDLRFLGCSPKLSGPAREMASLILVRRRLANGPDLAALLPNPSASVRAEVRAALTALPPDDYAIDRWSELLAIEPLHPDLEELAAGWMPKAGVGHEAWRSWLKAEIRGRPSPSPDRLDGAIERGIKVVRRRLGNLGQAGLKGERALLVYTLLKGGVAPDDPGVAPELSTLARGARSCDDVYDLSLRAMAFSEALGTLKTEEARRPLKAALAAAAAVLRGAQLREGDWCYGRPETTDGEVIGDHSNTQFALLGLRAAMNQGVEVPPETWKRTEAYWAGEALPGGGWDYGRRGGSRTGVNTAAGLTSMLIARSTLTGKAPSELLREAPLDAAFSWLQREYRLYPSPYWLWCLERFCMTAGVEWFDGHDWYRESAEFLIGSQNRNGSWTGSYSEPIDTCFALLFLRRAHVPVATPGGKRAVDVETPGGENRRQK